MRNHFTSLLTSALLVCLSACQTPEATVDRVDVERIIRTLAADDMQGRATFSPGIEKASRFLEEEFDEIGLETLEGLDSYEQAFHVFSLTPRRKEITLNGTVVPGNKIFFSIPRESVSWSADDGIDIINIGPDGDLRSTYGELRRSEDRALVLVDESHGEMFSRYAQFLSGPTRTVELGEGGVVFVLTSETEADSYNIEIENDVEELDLNNVVGTIPGRREDEIVLFSGHYDHVGIRSGTAPDSIYNGANDDASGTTAVVTLARYFKALGKPERTLVFAAFTAEEMGGYGSRYFSKQLNPDQIIAMFNIEMIGKPAVEGPNTAWITGFERSTFGEIIQQAVEGTSYRFYPDPYPEQNLFYRSDNATLARLGVPAHSISTTPIDVDGDYHQASDEVETLDLDHMTNTIIAIASGAETIISGEATPTRVDVSQVR